MKYDRRMYLSLFWILAGTALFLCGALEWIDSFWSGMGGGLLVVGILQIARHIRYRKDKEYREKVDVANNDERNHYLNGKAWAWAGYWFVLICGVAIIVLKLLGQDMWSYAASLAVCLLMILRWITYMVLKRKY